MAVQPRDDSYNFLTPIVSGGKARTVIVSLNRTHISIDGIRKSWQNARSAFEADSSPRELADAETRRPKEL